MTSTCYYTYVQPIKKKSRVVIMGKYGKGLI